MRRALLGWIFATALAWSGAQPALRPVHVDPSLLWEFLGSVVSVEIVAEPDEVESLYGLVMHAGAPLAIVSVDLAAEPARTVRLTAGAFDPGLVSECDGVQVFLRVERSSGRGVAMRQSIECLAVPAGTMLIRQDLLAVFAGPPEAIPEPWKVRTNRWLILGGAELRPEEFMVEQPSIRDGLSFFMYVGTEPYDDRLPDLPDYDSWDAAVEGNSSAPR